MSRGGRKPRNRANPALQPVAGWRRSSVVGLMAVGAVLLLGRAFELQVTDREFLQSEGAKRSVRTIEIPAYRGAIRDRSGEPLALSAPVDSVWAVPGELLAAGEYIAPLARLLDTTPAALRSELEGRTGRQFVWLKRHLPPAEAARVTALGAPGVFATREYRRYYPSGEIAAQIVGITNIDGRGIEGMEAAHDAMLSGRAGSRRVVRARDGRVVEEFGDMKPAHPGEDLRLSIDLRMQYLAHRELKAAVQRHDAKGGMVVVADAITGEVLAMASQPGFNPNRRDSMPPGAMRNRVITDIFEPGSSIKPLLVAQALDIGAISPDMRIDTGNGLMRVGRLTVRDVSRYGEVDLARMLHKSSNVGAVKIGLELGPEGVYNGYQRFGIGEPLYSGFPGESTGVFRFWMDWGQIGTATASYGYGLSLSALHLVRAYAAIANGGLMPHMRLTSAEAPVPPQRAVSRDAADRVRRMLAGVVSIDGTGLRAAVPGYTVAGKTGTVRKIGESGYEANRHQSLFIGMLPAEQPRLVGLVMIDEPRSGAYYGGEVAAPVFSAVMQGAAHWLQLPPEQHTPGVTTAATPPRGPNT
jgi:cell division protein FtsI (penicillin-binding protein 3)